MSGVRYRDSGPVWTPDSYSVRKPVRLWWAALPVLALLSGCAIPNVPITQQDQAVMTEIDRQLIFADQEPVTAPVSLDEAFARALKYNLDYRLTIMEQALQQRQIDVSRYDLLPRLAASAGYTARSNDSASASESLRTHRQSLEPSVSQDRERGSADLTMSWNVLDFGVSYYAAKQQVNRSLIAQERRRKTVHSVMQQVRNNFWQVANAQRLEPVVRKMLKQAQAALKDSREVERQNLLPPIEALRYQKAVLEIVRQLQTQLTEMSLAKTQLAALMNLPPGTEYRVAVPQGEMAALPVFRLSLDEMERLALSSRPELREEGYQVRIGADEVRKAMAKMLPGLTFTTGVNYDSNSYLTNHSWAEAGLRFSWNIFSLLTGPANIRSAESQQEVGHARRMALCMAVLAQVHVGYRQLERAREQYQFSDRLTEIEKRINRITAETTETDANSKLERIRTAAGTLAAEIARDRAMAEVQAAAANLYVSMGLDPLPQEIAAHDVATVAQEAGQIARAWQRGDLPQPPEAILPGATAATGTGTAGVPVTAGTPAPAAVVAPVASVPAPAPVSAAASVPVPAPLPISSAASAPVPAPLPISSAPVPAPVSAAVSVPVPASAISVAPVPIMITMPAVVAAPVATPAPPAEETPKPQPVPVTQAPPRHKPVQMAAILPEDGPAPAPALPLAPIPAPEILDLVAALPPQRPSLTAPDGVRMVTAPPPQKPKLGPAAAAPPPAKPIVTASLPKPPRTKPAFNVPERGEMA